MRRGDINLAKTADIHNRWYCFKGGGLGSAEYLAIAIGLRGLRRQDDRAWHSSSDPKEKKNLLGRS